MLVLSRRVNEKIVLPTHRVEVKVLRVDHNRVRLGITAPPEVSVRRRELAGRIDKERNYGPSQ